MFIVSTIKIYEKGRALGDYHLPISRAQEFLESYATRFQAEESRGVLVEIESRQKKMGIVLHHPDTDRDAGINISSISAFYLFQGKQGYPSIRTYTASFDHSVRSFHAYRNENRIVKQIPWPVIDPDKIIANINLSNSNQHYGLDKSIAQKRRGEKSRPWYQSMLELEALNFGFFRSIAVSFMMTSHSDWHHEMEHDDYLEFNNSFQADIEDALVNFILNLEPNLACYTEYIRNGLLLPDQITWLIQPLDPAIRARRLKAFETAGGFRQYLFKRDELANSSRSYYFYCPGEIEGAIDKGDDVYQIMSDYHNINIDLLHKYSSRLGPVTIYKDPFKVIKVMEALPWLSLPQEPGEEFSCFLEVFGGAEYDFLKRHSYPLAMIVLRLSIFLHDQIEEARAGIPICWRDALASIRLSGGVRDKIDNDLNRPLAQLARHLILPIYAKAYVLRSGGSHDKIKFTAKDHEAALVVAETCLSQVFCERGAKALQNPDAFLDISNQVDAYCQSLREDQKTVDQDDPYFKFTGFLLDDTAANQKLYEMYRDIIFAPDGWEMPDTLEEFLSDIGFYTAIEEPIQIAINKAQEPKFALV